MHFFSSCIAAETRFEQEICLHNRLCDRRLPSVNHSAFFSESSDDEDEGVQDVGMKVIPFTVSESNPKLMSSNENGIAQLTGNFYREQNATCASEILVVLTKLFAEGNQLVRGDRSRAGQFSSLMPIPSVSTVMESIFKSLSVFEARHFVQLQAMHCLVEMASLFPVVLCERLITLVQWIGGSNNEFRSKFLRLDDLQNLSLVGRLTYKAVPLLIRASKQRVEASLRVLDVFIRGFPDLPFNLPRRSVALYIGVLRGLSRVVSPTSPPSTNSNTFGFGYDSSASKRSVRKRAALKDWLWIASTFFLKTDWPSQEIGMSAGF